MIDKERNTQIALSKEDNRRLRMMAANKGVGAKALLSELIEQAWVDSPLSAIDGQHEENVQAAIAANA